MTDKHSGTSAFKANDRPVYNTGTYICLLSACKETLRVPFGTKEPDKVKDEDKTPGFDWDFEMVRRNEPFVNNKPNFITDPNTEKPVLFRIMTGTDATSVRSAVRILLQRLAGRPLTNEEIRRIDPQSIVASKPLFELSVVKTQNDDLEFLNKVEGITPFQCGAKTFKIESAFLLVADDGPVSFDPLAEENGSVPDVSDKKNKGEKSEPANPFEDS